MGYELKISYRLCVYIRSDVKLLLREMFGSSQFHGYTSPRLFKNRSLHIFL